MWRAAGAKIVAPKTASFSQNWLMPMLTDYGVYPPRPVDIALPLTRVGDEVDFEVSGFKFHALFVPGHSFDLTLYTTVLGGKRIAFIHPESTFGVLVELYESTPEEEKIRTGRMQELRHRFHLERRAVSAAFSAFVRALRRDQKPAGNGIKIKAEGEMPKES